LVIVFSGIVISSQSQNFFFTKAVSVGEFVDQGEGIYAANITDGNTIVKKIYVNVGAALSDPGNVRRHPIFIQIPYSQAELDSVTLWFSSDTNGIVSLYSKASSYVWDEVSPHQENNGYVYKVNDLGLYGTGAVNFEFYIDLFENVNHLTIEADLSMHHRAPIQLPSLTAHVFLDTVVPPDIQTTT